MSISLIAAMDKNTGIGFQGDMPWRGKVPADMKRFRGLTLGHTVVMGRKTFESLGRPLPGRENIVLSRNSDWSHEGVLVLHSPEALSDIHERELFIIGGAELFKIFLPLAETMYLTEINGIFPADTFFPQYKKEEWLVTDEATAHVDEKNLFALKFLTLTRN